MNMENAFQMPSREKDDLEKRADSGQGEQERELKNAEDFFRQAQNHVQQLMEAQRKPGNDDEIEELKRGMKLVRNLAEDQMALAGSDEDKERFRKTIALIENNL